MALCRDVFKKHHVQLLTNMGAESELGRYQGLQSKSAAVKTYGMLAVPVFGGLAGHIAYTKPTDLLRHKQAGGVMLALGAVSLMV